MTAKREIANITGFGTHIITVERQDWKADFYAPAKNGTYLSDYSAAWSHGQRVTDNIWLPRIGDEVYVQWRDRFYRIERTDEDERYFLKGSYRSISNDETMRSYMAEDGTVAHIWFHRDGVWCLSSDGGMGEVEHLGSTHQTFTQAYLRMQGEGYAWPRRVKRFAEVTDRPLSPSDVRRILAEENAGAMAGVA